MRKLLFIFLVFAAPLLSVAQTNMPSIPFVGSKISLGTNGVAMAEAAASIVRSNADMNVIVQSYGNENKKAQQLSWDRTNAVKRYLVDKEGINEDRIIFQYGGEGDGNMVDLKLTKEEGPNAVPPPSPNLRRKN